MLRDSMISMPRSLRDGPRVDRRDARLQHRLEEADQHRVGDHVGPAGGQVAVVTDAERLDAAVVHLRQEVPEPLAELEERLQPA